MQKQLSKEEFVMCLMCVYICKSNSEYYKNEDGLLCGAARDFLTCPPAVCGELYVWLVVVKGHVVWDAVLQVAHTVLI